MSPDRPLLPPVSGPDWTVAIFVLLGPFIGSIGLIVFTVATGGMRSPITAGLCVNIVMLGYVFGLVPALTTGLAVAWRKRLALPATVSGLLCGALLSAAFGALVSAMFGAPKRDIKEIALMFLGMGALAGLICGCVSDLRQRSVDF
jgi:hypothetical protein